jgi:hypothetical protein
MKHARNRSGQALAELIVAIVVFMVLLASVIQLGLLGLRRSEAMLEARRQAGVRAMQVDPTFAGPEYIHDRALGADGVDYSCDDGIDPGNVNDFQNRIAAYAHPDELQTRAPSNLFSQIALESFPQLSFGFVKGESRTNVALLPVVQDLLYSSAEIGITGTAWMVWTKGIY